MVRCPNLIPVLFVVPFACAATSDLDKLCSAAAAPAKPTVPIERRFVDTVTSAERSSKDENFKALMRALTVIPADARVAMVHESLGDLGVKAWTCPAFERLASGVELLALDGAALKLNGVATNASLSADARCDRDNAALTTALAPLAAGGDPGLSPQALAARGPSEPTKIRLDVTPSTPLCSLARTLQSVRKAGFAEVRIGDVEVQREKGSNGAKPLSLALTIAIGARGVSVAATGGALRGTDDSAWTLPGPGHAFDAAKLAKLIVDVKKTFPNEEEVVITGDDALPFDVVARALGVVVKSNDGKLLFPAVSIVTLDEANVRLGKETFRRSGASFDVLRGAK